MPATEPVDTIKMVFIGDVMMHKPQLSHDHTVFLSDIAPLLSDADIAVANAEFTLAGRPYTGYPAFSAPDSYAGSILAAGVDVLLTANNHILDKGENGLSRTLEVYSRYPFLPVAGSGRNEAEYRSNNPLILLCKGAKIALVNVTYGTNLPSSGGYPKVSYLREQEIREQFGRARRAGADFIIALPHWGEEYKTVHNASQRRWAEFFVELGAGAVVGEHPHVVQDTSFIAGVPVIYSMGNAVSNMSARNTRLELAVELNLLHHRVSGETRLLRPVLHFLWCTLPGKLMDSYMTVELDRYEGKRHLWKDKSDYDNMMQTLERVKKETGIQ